MTGGRGGQQPTGPQIPPPAPAAPPPGGQSWGTPWGPDQQQNPPSPPAQPGWGTPPGRSGQPWGAPEQPYQPPAPAPWDNAPQQAGGEQGRPLPPEGSGPSYGGSSYGGGSPQPSYGQDGAQSAPLPPAGGDAYGSPGQNSSGQDTPSPHAGRDTYGAPSAPLPPAGSDGYAAAGQGAPRDAYGAPSASLPPAGRDAYGSSGQDASPPHAGRDTYGAPSAPVPPAGGDSYGSPGYGTPGAGAPLPPAVHGNAGAPGPHTGAGGFGAALPPAGDEGATQFLPPVSAGAVDDAATRYIPPVAADEGATQFIPPVGPGALPPEVRHAGQGGAGPLPPVSGPDAEATQYIAPVADQPYGMRPGGGQDRQPPAEFDNLFRSEPGGESPAAATQQMPRFQQPQPQVRHSAPSAYFPPGDQDDVDGGRRGGRTGSRLPVIAAVGVGIAVLGVGAGALLAGGGDDQDDKNQPVSATAPATESGPPAADPAEQQAIALDKLLADSGDSRTAVINAVASVKSCKNLAQAATDLRDAAKQRNQLVTDLKALSVDKLPNNAELTAALTKAWQASAAADNHYAAWADQVAGNRKNLCKGGQARVTGQTQAGNRESGTATTQKRTAAQLWNSIAGTYGLTERQPTQL
ncbi:hypothetical protein [Streptomyces dysideae]